MAGSDEGAWLFQLITRQLLSCLITFRVALFVSLKTENERSNPKSASIIDEQWPKKRQKRRFQHWRCTFNLWCNILETPLRKSCLLWLHVKHFPISRHFTLHCSCVQTLWHVERKSGLTFPVMFTEDKKNKVWFSIRFDFICWYFGPSLLTLYCQWSILSSHPKALFVFSTWCPFARRYILKSYLTSNVYNVAILSVVYILS